MTAVFTYRGVQYLASGWLWANDGARNSLRVERCDGNPIRGSRMHPGMIQLGLSRALQRLAERALEAEREAHATEVAS